jgi:hypothetical protein
MPAKDLLAAWNRDGAQPRPAVADAGSAFPSPQVVTALTATTTGQKRPLPDNGTVESIAIVFPNGDTVPHGRIYLVVEFLNRQGDVVERPWSGYATSAGTPSCRPGTRLEPGMQVRLVATQNNQGAGVTVQANIWCTDAEPFPGVPFFEAPATGPGEHVTIALPAPAAGADYAAQTVPAKCRWKLRGIKAQITTGISAGTRQFIWEMNDGANIYAGVPFGTNSTFGNSATVDFRAFGDASMAGSNASGQTLGGTAPSGDYLFAGHQVAMRTAGIQASDQWNAGKLGVEEWAVP